jgi:menaquinol-cytochrome c reductase iron-sulfur subunit
MDTPGKSSVCCEPIGTDTEARRGFFLQAVTLLLGGLALLVPAATAIVAFLNPLRQKGGGGRFLRVTTLEALPEDGTPQRFPVVADRTDAWNYYPSGPIGAVFLRRTGDPKDPVLALHVVCPHAGCYLQYRHSGEGGEFLCPCHAATFDLNGKRREVPSQSPRDMDSLEVDAQRLRAGEVWVKFQDFQTGRTAKVERA